MNGRPDLQRFELSRVLKLRQLAQLKRLGKWKDAIKLMNEIDPSPHTTAEIVDLRRPRSRP
jgi:hypothetical protein